MANRISVPQTTVSFFELAGSPRESFTTEGFQAVRRFLVRWEDRENFARDVLGNSDIFNYRTSTFYPNRPSVFPVHLTFQPADEKTLARQEISALHLGLNSYDGWALAEIEYETLTEMDLDFGIDAEAGTRLTYRLSWEAVDTELPTDSGWVWKDTQEPVPQDLTVIQRIPQALHVIVWSQVQNPPWVRIQETQGKVNASEFLDCPPGTLLFEGASANKLYRATFEDGESPYCWAITFTFRQKAVHHGGSVYGWNHFFRTEDGKWAVLENHGEPIYDSAEFAPLFESAS